MIFEKFHVLPPYESVKNTLFSDAKMGTTFLKPQKIIQINKISTVYGFPLANI